MKKLWVLKAFLFSALRRASYRTPYRQECLKKYRIKRGYYTCAECKNIFRKKDIAIDHIDPVINPLTGFLDWNEYINRLFCDETGLQVLCNNGKESCHKRKTKLENKARRLSKGKKK